MARNEVEFKTIVDLKQAISFFEDILKGLKKGTIYVEHEGNGITLKPEEQMITFGFEAKQKEEKEKISFKLSWKKTMINEEDGGDFKIMSAEPKPKKEEPTATSPAEGKKPAAAASPKKPESKPAEKKEKTKPEAEAGPKKETTPQPAAKKTAARKVAPKSDSKKPSSGGATS